MGKVNMVIMHNAILSFVKKHGIINSAGKWMELENKLSEIARD